MRVTDWRPLVMVAGAVGLTCFVFANTRINDVNDAVGYVQAAKAVRKAAGIIPTPRIVLAGGSNVVFGQDAQLIALHLGRPVVNAGIFSLMGGHSNYSDWLVTIVRPGDIVVFSDSNWMVNASEHKKIDRQETRMAALMEPKLKIHFSLADRGAPPAWSLLPNRPWLAVFISSMKHSREALSYDPGRRDRWGDAPTCLPAAGTLKPMAQVDHFRASQAIQQAGRLANRLRAVGVRTVFTIPQTLVELKDVPGWNDYVGRLERELAKWGSVLHRPVQTIILTDPAMFCDYPTHVSAIAREQRSLDLAASLSHMSALRQLKN